MNTSRFSFREHRLLALAEQPNEATPVEKDPGAQPVSPPQAADTRQGALKGFIDKVGGQLATNEAQKLVDKLPGLARTVTGKRAEGASVGGEMTNEALEKLSPYDRVAALTAEAMNGSVPGLRADLSSLVPELQRVNSYNEMSRESYSTMARNHNVIIQYALSRGMTPDQVEQARMQIPNNTKGTLSFINRAFEFAGGSPERGAEAINAAEVIALLIKLVELVILAIQKMNEQKSEKVEKVPAAAEELTAEKIIASGMTPEKVKETRADKAKEAEKTEDEKKTAEGDLATAEKAGPDLSKQKTSLDDRLKKLKEDPAKNVDEIKTVEGELKKATQAVEDNTKRVAELKEWVEALGKKAEALKREIAALDAVIVLDATVDQVNAEKAKLPPALQKALGGFTLDRTGIVLGKPEGQLHRLFGKKDREKVSLEDARKGLIEQLQAMSAPAKEAPVGQRREDFDGNVWRKLDSGMWEVVDGFKGFPKGSSRNGDLMDRETKRLVPEEKKGEAN